MRVIKTSLVLLMILVLKLNLSAQELKVETSSSVNIEQLPEYLIITSENTKLLGGIDIVIDSKKSKYRDQLLELESLLQNRKKLRIRNQTDLLTALSQLGYEYVDAYSAGSDTFNSGDSDFSSGTSKVRVNMVFRKKDKFRD